MFDWLADVDVFVGDERIQQGTKQTVEGVEATEAKTGSIPTLDTGDTGDTGDAEDTENTGDTEDAEDTEDTIPTENPPTAENPPKFSPTSSVGDPKVPQSAPSFTAANAQTNAGETATLSGKHTQEGGESGGEEDNETILYDDTDSIAGDLNTTQVGSDPEDYGDREEAGSGVNSGSLWRESGSDPTFTDRNYTETTTISTPLHSSSTQPGLETSISVLPGVESTTFNPLSLVSSTEIADKLNDVSSGEDLPGLPDILQTGTDSGLDDSTRIEGPGNPAGDESSDPSLTDSKKDVILNDNKTQEQLSTQSLDQSPNQTTEQSPNQTTEQSPNQTTEQSSNQTTELSPNQTTQESQNQSTEEGLVLSNKYLEIPLGKYDFKYLFVKCTIYSSPLRVQLYTAHCTVYTIHGTAVLHKHAVRFSLSVNRTVHNS